MGCDVNGPGEGKEAAISRACGRHDVVFSTGETARMKQAGHCIYCRHTGPPSDFSTEHVVQESIGGSLKLPQDFVCKGCNDEMGRTIDAAVAKMFQLTRHLYGATTKKENELKTCLSVTPSDGRKRRAIMKGQGEIDIPDPPIGDASAIDLSDSSAAELSHQFRCGHWEFERGLTKCPFNLVALKKGRDVALDSAFDAVRDFIRCGKGEPQLHCQKVEAFSVEFPVDPKPHRIQIFPDGNALVAHCRFFDVFEFEVVLSEESSVKAKIDEFIPTSFTKRERCGQCDAVGNQPT